MPREIDATFKQEKAKRQYFYIRLKNMTAQTISVLRVLTRM